MRSLSLFKRNTIPQSFSYKILNDSLKKFLSFYLTILLIAIAIGAWHQVGFHEGFNIGDWLINYQGGFVRRGLMGEMFYELSRVTGINPAILLIVFQTVAFAIYFYFSFRLLRLKDDLIKYSLLIFSPFLFTFAINSQAGGYRKEILYFDALAIIAFSYALYDREKFNRIAILTFFFYPIVLLADEVGAVVLPAMAGIYVMKNAGSRKAYFALAVLLWENIFTFFFVVFQHQATQRQVAEIFRSLRKEGYNIDGAGAIGALSDSITVNFSQVKESFVHGEIWFIYPVAIFLCSIAYIPLRRHIQKIWQTFPLRLGALGSFFMLIPLFVIAQDWGRWIYILLVELFFFILIVDKEKYSEVYERRQYGRLQVILSIFFIIVYGAFWYLPHVLYSQDSLKSIFHNI